MGVCGDRQLIVCMPYDILKNPQVDALQHEPGRVCVPEIVDAVRRFDACCLLRRAPPSPECFGRDWHEIGSWKQIAHGFAEDRRKLRADWHDAHTGGRLRRRGDKLPFDADALTLDTY